VIENTATMAPSSQSLASLLLLRGAFPEIATLKMHRKETSPNNIVTKNAELPNDQAEAKAADSE